MINYTGAAARVGAMLKSCQLIGSFINPAELPSENIETNPGTWRKRKRKENAARVYGKLVVLCND